MINAQTKFQEFQITDTLKQEWHEDGDSGELVVVHTRAVPGVDGECVDFEFEELLRYPPLGCIFAKVNVNRNQPITSQQVDEINKLRNELFAYPIDGKFEH